jgi:hypothetical protein
MRHSLATLFVLIALLAAAGCSGDDGAASGPRSAGAAPAPADAFREVDELIETALGARLDRRTPSTPDDVKGKLEHTEPAIAELIEMTRLKQRDEGISLDEDLRAELEHLPQTRALARVLCIDALRLADLGDPDSAAERLAAVVRMSARAAQGDLLVTRVVAMANMLLVTDSINELIGQNALGTGHRTLIGDALATLPDDPFDVRGALTGEFDLLAQSLRRGLVDARLTGGPVPSERRELAAVELERLGRELPEAWDAPDAVAAIGEVEASVDDDLVRAIMPSISGFRVQYERTQAAIEAVETALSASAW